MSARRSEGQRTCGWCGVVTSAADRSHCQSCGGPLPALPRATTGSLVRAPEPPSPPRELPRGYPFRVTWSRNVMVIIGVVFTAIYVPIGIGTLSAALAEPEMWMMPLVFAVFPLVGVPMLVFGLRRARAKLDALRTGTAADGMIVGVRLDTSTTINGRHPWRIEYVFDGPDGPVHGRAESWDRVSGELVEGEPVWVVYVADDPHRNALWPPVR